MKILKRCWKVNYSICLLKEGRKKHMIWWFFSAPNQRNWVFEWVNNNMRTTKKRAKLSVYKLYISKAEKWEPINPFNIETNYFVYRIIWHCWGSAKVSHRAIVILTDGFQDMNVHSGIPKNVILSDGHIIRWALYSQINVLSPMKHTEAQGCDVLWRMPNWHLHLIKMTWTRCLFYVKVQNEVTGNGKG